MNIMKRFSNILPGLLFFSMLLIQACKKDFDAPPPPMDPNLTVTHSIRQLKALHATSGAIDVIDNVSYVVAQPLALKGINKTEKVRVLLYHDKKRGKIEYSTEKIDVTIRVQKFTEASVELPILVENLPAGYSLKMFPDKVQVKYNVAFDNYEKINASGFRAIIDFSKIQEGDNKVKVQLVEFPEEIRAVKLNPEKVEYIIKK